MKALSLMVPLALATALLVQTTPAATAAGAPAAKTQKAATLADGDRQFLAKAQALDSNEVIGGVMAKRAGSAPVQALASKLSSDHKSLAAQVSQLARKNGVTLDIGGAGQKSPFEAMSNLQGAAFDKAYLAATISGHQEAVALFEKASKESQNAEIRSFAGRTLPALRSHLAEAEKLQQPA